MPKKGVKLPAKIIEATKDHLKINKMTQEELAKKLGITLKTLNNWLAGRSTIDRDKLDYLIKILGIGLEDLFDGQVPEGFLEEYVFHENAVRAVWRVYKSGLAEIGQRIYRKIGELFRERVSFALVPKTGFFQIFEHDAKKSKNYYFQFWIQPEEEVVEAKFIISFTMGDVVRINYGEIIVNSDSVAIKQYYQPPDYQVNRPEKNICMAKVVTWFDEMSHTFVVVSDIKFKIVEKGRISEDELKRVKNQANDIAVFPKHFFFHEDT